MVCIYGKCDCNKYTRRVEDFCDPTDWRCPHGDIYKDADGSSELCRSNLKSYNDICDSGYYCNPIDDVSGQTGNITVNGICCPKHKKVSDGVIKTRAVCPVGKPLDVYSDCKRYCPEKTHFCHKDPYLTHLKELCCPRACHKGFYFNGFSCMSRL
ncbi:EB module family protein [Trichuris trichiura]|uniref:EB module family protein n=1 Tax=Trichuris trichiura TaxID=36087 RepID=A0A077ZD91_TRITR|nr:EB module family protein [Trichuris trichiura]